MLSRFVAFLVLFWIIGFAWFATALPQPVGPDRTDAVIVLTGGEGRIARGLETLRKGWAGRMLVSGVDREVRTREFEAEYHVSHSLLRCCITLGYDAFDTRSNAAESARWIEENKVESVRLVTTDWHMPRAAFELSQAIPANVRIVRDAVSSQPRLRDLFLEYNKLLARHAARAWGD